MKILHCTLNGVLAVAVFLIVIFALGLWPTPNDRTFIAAIAALLFAAGFYRTRK